MDVHPLALLLPPMSPDEFDTLRTSIRQHGQLEPARVFDGQLLDGRHRQRACAELGIDLRIAPFEGDEDAARIYVLATNVHRRHLTPSQRALSAAALATRTPGRPAKGGTGAGLAQAEAASLAGVSERSLRDAKLVLTSPELTEQVVSGVSSVKAAATALRALNPRERSTAFHAVRREAGSDEWLTPPHIIERVVQVLGRIDVDPCADDACTVPAGRHITEADDALRAGCSWDTRHGKPSRVFMNPPYVTTWQFVRKLLREYQAGRVDAAVLLVPARLGSEWLASLAEFPRVELTGRLAFIAGPRNPARDSEPRAAHFSSLLIGVGLTPDAMYDTFGDLGPVMVEYKR